MNDMGQYYVYATYIVDGVKKKKTYIVDKTTYCGNKMGAKYVLYETVKRTCTIHSSLINPKLNKFT